MQYKKIKLPLIFSVIVIFFVTGLILNPFPVDPASSPLPTQAVIPANTPYEIAAQSIITETNVSPTSVSAEDTEPVATDAAAAALDDISVETTPAPVATETRTSDDSTEVTVPPPSPTSVPTQPTTGIQTVESPTRVPDDDGIEDAIDSGRIERAVLEQINQKGSTDVVINLLDASDLITLSSSDYLQRIDEAQRQIQHLLDVPADQITLFKNLPALVVEVNRAQLGLLAENGFVNYVQIDYEIQASINTISEEIGLSQEGIRTTTSTGEGVTIAVVDSGIDPAYAAFDNGAAIINRECFLENQRDCVPGSHGTLMAHIIRDIAPDVSLVDYQVLAPDGNGVYSGWLLALDRLVEQQSTLDIDIVNLSIATTTLFAGQCDSIYPAASAAIYQLRQAGVSIFAAVGNDGLPGRTASPACLRQVVGVGASYLSDDPAQLTDLDINPSCEGVTTADPLQVTCFSNVDTELALLAPGTGIMVESYDPNMLTYGTSQGTALISAISSLLLDINPYYSPEQIFQTLVDAGEMISVDNKSGPLNIPVLTDQAVSDALVMTENAVFSCEQVTTIPETECDALLALYYGTSGPQTWVDVGGWAENFNPCEWAGVSCTSGRVTALRLNQNGLSNNGATVALPPEVGELTGLVELFIAGNQINTLPTSLQNLENLVEADLGHNAVNIYDVSGSGHNNPDLIELINRTDPDWRETQTYAPINVNAWAPSCDQLNVLWSPIFYNTSPGFYTVRCGTLPGGPYNALVTQTTDKTSSSVSFSTGVSNDTRYYCIVSTTTAATDFNPNTLTSDNSDTALGSTFTEDVGGATLSFNPIEDVFVASTLTNPNSTGDRVGMFIGDYFIPEDNSTFRDSQTLLNFGVLPSTLAIEDATISVYVYATGPNLDPNVDITSVNSAWNEVTLWGNRPLPTASDIRFGQFNFPAVNIGFNVSEPERVDLTASESLITYLQDTTNEGLRLWLENPANTGLNGSVICASEPGNVCTADNAPELAITLASAPPTSNPVPRVDAKSIAIDTSFSWDFTPDPQGDTLTYNFYLGSSENDLALVKSGISTNAFEDGAGIDELPLAYGQQIFWRVDTVDSQGTTVGEIWNFWTTFCDPAGVIPQTECEALETLALANNVSDWQYPDPTIINLPATAGQSEWLVSPVCDWFGIVCESGHVVEIHLSGTGIRGENISSVRALPQLRVLDLSNNMIGGTLPSDIGTLSNLVTLNLSNNNFRGAIPPEIGNLTALVDLDLSNNRLNSQLPATMANLGQLQRFVASNNELSGEPFTVLGNLTKLHTVLIDQNHFMTTTGMRGVGNLVNLAILDISYNGFGFFLPVELASLPLTEIDLSHNRLELPPSQDASVLVSFLAGLQPRWAVTQTIPPTITSPTDPIGDTWEPRGNSIIIEWEAIPYANQSVYTGKGYYQAQCAANDGSQTISNSSQWLITNDLTATGIVVNELFPAMEYNCDVRSFIPAQVFADNQQQKNNLLSRSADIVDNIPTGIPDLNGNSLDDPVIVAEEDLPYKTIIDMRYYDKFGRGTGDEPPECLTDQSGRRSYSYFYGGDGQTPMQVVADGSDGANTAIAIIVEDENGNLVYVECVTNIEDTETATTDALTVADPLDGEDAVLNFYPEPDTGYYIVAISEGNSVGKIDLSIEYLTFRGCTGDNLDVSQAECQALVDLYYNTGGAVSWIRHDNWLNSSLVCSWAGITCSMTPDQSLRTVIGLELPANQLQGELPESLGNLTNLQTLNLQYNELRRVVPDSIVNLSNLRSVNLSHNLLKPASVAVEDFLTDIRADAFSYMTLPPTAINFQSDPQRGTVIVSWNASPYAAGTGYFELGTALQPGGPYTFTRVPGDKNTTSMEVTSFMPETEYYIVVRMISEEDLFFPRTLVSDLSAERTYFTPDTIGLAALPDSVRVKRNASTILDVRSNDRNPAGGTLTIVDMSTPVHGSVSLIGTGDIRYKAAIGYTGEDSFNYTVENSLGQRSTTTVVLTVVRMPDNETAIPTEVENSSPTPTAEPEETAEPTATATSTASPTATTEPTETAEPTATATSTASPTATTEPTETAEPTATATSTASPTATLQSDSTGATVNITATP